MKSHDVWINKVIKENKYIVVDSLNNVCMISTTINSCKEFVAKSENK